MTDKAEAAEPVTIEYALRQIIEADDKRELTQQLIEIGRAALKAQPAPIEAQGAPTAEQYDEMLRALCCQYGVGGYNSDGLINPDVAGEKLTAALDEQFRVGGELSFNRARGELRAAAAAVVARWDSPKWKDEAHTGVFIDRLREALEASAGSASESTEARMGSGAPAGAGVAAQGEYSAP